MRINVVAIALSLFIFKVTVAQPWHSSNPFGSTGCNVVEILKQGSIVAGGGRLSPDSLQIMFSSRDYGQTWTENQNDGLFSWNKSIAFTDSLNGIGVGDNGRIIRTVNGGLTWNNSASPIARNFNKIINVSPLIYYAVGGLKDSVQTIIKTNDGGLSWSVVRDTTGAMLNSVFFINPAVGYAVGDSGMILTTNNGGSLWSQTITNLHRDFNAIKFINADTGYIAGGLDAANQTRTILKTVNAGLQWNVIVDLAGSEIREISFSDGRNGFMVGDSAAFLTSTDGGNSWIQQLVPGASSNERFNSVRFFSADFGVVGSASGTVYVYTHHLFPVPLIQNEAAVFKSGTLSLAAAINTYGNPDNVSFYIAVDSLLTSPSKVGPIPFNSSAFAPAIADVSYLFATPGTYYFSCVVSNLDSTYFGDTISFIVPSHLPEITTLSSSNISTHSLTLNGAVRNLPGPSNIYFEYLSSFDSSTITVAALPAVVNDTQAYTVLANIAGLIPYLNYDVRVKAVHGNLVMYGNYIAFSSTGQTVIADNRPATNVTSTSATLWAQVGYLPFRSQVDFEYSLAGDSTIYTIPATPFLITDQGVYNVSANIGNLLPGNLYRYRVKILDSTQVIYGGMDTYFFTGSAQSVAVDSVSNVTLTSADLYGHVNDIHFNADVFFTYWAQGIATQSAVGTPGSIYDTLNHVVSASISGLMPYTTYNYSINANDPPYLLQSTPGTFYTGPLNQTPLVLTVDPASNVDSNSATLSGTVNHLASAGQVYFEYWQRGTNPILVSALPSNINDTLMHHVAVSITGLNPSSLYLYRIKISGSFGTVYSDSVSFFMELILYQTLILKIGQ